MESRLYTIEDLAQIDEPCELDEGRLVFLNPPKTLHGLCCSRFSRILGNYVEMHQLGAVLCNDSGYILGRNPDTVRGPDVSFIRRERLEDLQEDQYLAEGPDLAVEVLSPDDRPGAVQRKVAQYLEAGTGLVWLADPRRKRITVYHTDGLVEVLRETDRITMTEVLPGFDYLVRDFFVYW